MPTGIGAFGHGFGFVHGEREGGIVLQGLSPTNGGVFTSVTVSGFGFTPNSTVILGSAGAQATTFVSSTSLTFDVDGAVTPGAYQVTVTDGGRTTGAITFTVDP